MLSHGLLVTSTPPATAAAAPATPATVTTLLERRDLGPVGGLGGTVAVARRGSRRAAPGRAAPALDRGQGSSRDVRRRLAEAELRVHLLGRHLWCAHAARASAFLLSPDVDDLHDVDELICHGDEVARRVGPEADHLAAHPHVLQGTDRGGEVAVAGHDDRDVHAVLEPEEVDDQLDVEVRLHPAIAELADVLVNDLVAVLREEVDELPLVLVFRVQPGIGIGANQVAPLGRVLEEGDVIDVDVLASSRVVHVGDVNEHRHVLAHGRALLL